MLKRLLVSALATASAAALPAAADAPCAAPKVVANVPIAWLKDGRFVIPVQVAGKNTFFLLGLANEYGMISKPLAAELKLPLEHARARFVGLDGEIVQTLGVAPTISIGPITFTNLRFAVGATGYTYKANTPPGAVEPSGSVGSDMVARYDLDIDFGAGRLKFIIPDGCNSNHPYWNPAHVARIPMTFSSQHRILFPMMLDGHHVQAALNTAIPRSALEMRTAKLTYGVDNASAGNEQAGTIGAEPLFARRFKSLSVGDIAYENPKIVLIPDRVEPAVRQRSNRMMSSRSESLSIPEFMLGVAELRGLHLYINFHDQVIYASPAVERAASN